MLYYDCYPNWNTFQVSLNSSSLNHSHVFILDAGKKNIFIWSGGKSKLAERSKARLIAERINKIEKKNTAVISSYRAVGQVHYYHITTLCFQGSEPEEFWDYFGGYPNESIKVILYPTS